jgi:hypothetical protein
MSKRGSARAALAGAGIVALAGCGVPLGGAPDVPGKPVASTASGVTPTAPAAARVPAARHSANSIAGTRTSTSRETGPGSFVTADSIPFPVAVGNMWVYQTTAGAVAGRTTNRIVSAGPGQDGYQVTMSSATDVPGMAAVQSIYVFYPDGTIGYPVPRVNGISVAGVVRWPDAAILASGRAYHSALRVPVGQGEAANVIVQGEGVTPVSVPAGTFQASIVNMAIATKVGTVEVTTWIAEGVGVVKTVALIRAAGKTDLLTTSELRSFTLEAVVRIGS